VNHTLDRTIPAAMILDARGAIQLHSPRGGSGRPVPQTLLYPDDRLTLAADAQVQLVFLSALHTERLQPGREATIGRKGCSPAAAVRERDDSVLMTFVRLPKGTFYMGWNRRPGSAKKTEIKANFEMNLARRPRSSSGPDSGGSRPGVKPSGSGGPDPRPFATLVLVPDELRQVPPEGASPGCPEADRTGLSCSQRNPGTWRQLTSKNENLALRAAEQSAAPKRNAFDPGQAARQPAWTPLSAVVDVVNRLAAYEGGGQSRLCTG
jgi:hypothetical protein